MALPASRNLEKLEVRWKRVIAALLLLFLAPVGAIAAEAGPVVIDLAITDRAVIPKNTSIRVTEGQDVVINWITDERVVLHLHGYDLSVTAKPGETASMKLNAATAGRFPITAHNYDHRALIYLEVYPE